MEQLRSSIFDVTVNAFDTSSVVRLRSSPNFAPDRIFALPFPVTLTTLTLNQRSSQWFGNNFWTSSPKGLPSSFLQLRATKQKKIALVAHRSLLCANLCALNMKKNPSKKLVKLITPRYLLIIPIV